MRQCKAVWETPSGISMRNGNLIRKLFPVQTFYLLFYAVLMIVDDRWRPGIGIDFRQPRQTPRDQDGRGQRIDGRRWLRCCVNEPLAETDRGCCDHRPTEITLHSMQPTINACKFLLPSKVVPSHHHSIQSASQPSISEVHPDQRRNIKRETA